MYSKYINTYCLTEFHWLLVHWLERRQANTLYKCIWFEIQVVVIFVFVHLFQCSLKCDIAHVTHAFRYSSVSLLLPFLWIQFFMLIKFKYKTFRTFKIYQICMHIEWNLSFLCVNGACICYIKNKQYQYFLRKCDTFFYVYGAMCLWLSASKIK